MRFFRKNNPIPPPDLTPQILAKLDEIEQELKAIGFWQADLPDLLEAVSRGEIQSHLDAPSFEAWLQGIFLPNARAAAEQKTFPPGSDVGLMAMRHYDYHEFVPEAQRLRRLLNEFDALIDQVNANARHE